MSSLVTQAVSWFLGLFKSLSDAHKEREKSRQEQEMMRHMTSQEIKMQTILARLNEDDASVEKDCGRFAGYPPRPAHPHLAVERGLHALDAREAHKQDEQQQPLEVSGHGTGSRSSETK